MIYVMYSHSKYKEKYVYSLDYKMLAPRYENGRRPDLAYIFRVEGKEKKYDDFEVAILKETFYHKVYNAVAADNEITFQNDELLNLVTDKGYRDGIQK